ncbi:MAG: phosphate ABC transporter permease PstA [Thermodesulfobacteriota bacterium]
MRHKFWRQGEPYVWATGLALALVLFLTLTLLGVVIANGIAIFWPRPLALAELTDGGKVLGEIRQREQQPHGKEWRYQFKVANREMYGLDFRWLDAAAIRQLSEPQDALVVERLENGNFHGFLREIRFPNQPPQPASDTASLTKARQAIIPLLAEVDRLNASIATLNARLEKIQGQLAKLRFRHEGSDAARITALEGQEHTLKAEFDALANRLADRRTALNQYEALFVDASGSEKGIALAEIVRFYQPNTMTVWQKSGYYLARLKELFCAEPREANTEGGLFPAIFGTIMLVFLMSIFSFPIGVLAGIYLREYAKEGILVKMVRIAVNNLAGIPSIVYGIFGLGFFIYGIGSTIDQLFFPERLPNPTFGTGGILWASLTLALLTVPVVIVATEEALGAIPPGIREGSQALAATKFQTLTKLLLPMASPGILTGFILAMARAAGEVAPLMITGVVKLAPSLPLDGQFPYLHLDRKFMHLGFHIYDIGFQSPNVEAAKPMVYVTTLLLILIVLVMTSTAIYLRNQMRKRYSVVDV